MLGQLAVMSVLVLGLQGLSVQVRDQGQCDLCTSAFTELKVIWADKDTQDLLALGKTFLCANVPITDCSNWVDTELATLGALLDGLDPNDACSILGFCEDLYQTRAPLQDTVQCEVCEFVGDQIKKRVATNATIDEVIAVTEAICAKLPFIGNECIALTKEYGHYYLELLAGSINVKELCVKAHLCSADLGFLLEAFDVVRDAHQSFKNEEGCQACKDGITVIQTVLKSPNLMDLVHIAVEEVCDLMGSDDNCELLVDAVLDGMIRKWVKKFDPDVICNDMGACPALVQVEVTPACEACTDGLGELKKVANDPETKTVLDNLAIVICEDISIPFCDKVIGGLIDSQLEKLEALDVDATCKSLGACVSFRPLLKTLELLKKVQDDSIPCHSCSDYVDEEIKDLLSDADGLVSLIKESIGEVCNVLPIPNCEQKLDAYVEKALDYIRTLNGVRVCEFLGVCKRELETLPFDTCSECTMIFDMLLKELNDPTVQAEIEAAIDEVCTVLPISNCKDTIHQYLVIAETFLASLDGKTLCAYVGLCSSCAKAPAVVAVGDTCSECVSIADEIISLIENSEVDSLVKEAIGELCSLLPIANCEATIDGYFDEIVALLKNLDGKTLCSLIGLCSSKSTVETPVIEFPISNVGDTCSECTLIAGEVISLIENAEVDSLVKEAIGEICSLVGIANCETVIDGYFDEIVALLKNMDGKTFCSLIGLC